MREFVLFSECWYAEHARGDVTWAEEVLITVEDGTDIMVRWYSVNSVLSPKLEVFDDAWQGLFGCHELCGYLESIHDQNVPPDDFCAALGRLGFKDATPRTRA